ncbi:MAG: ABC transporter substrate-binding protein [Chloroflexi bacterium]|nr:ABC transporter substrate-binding protein [Chloroflexota bacterium]
MSDRSRGRPRAGLPALLLSLAMAALSGCTSTAQPAAGSSPASAAASAGSSGAPAGLPKLAPLSPAVKVKLAANPELLAYLPMLLALDKGYFSAAGLDVELVPFRGGSSQVLSQLATGEVDFSGTTPSPGLYNAAAQGFGAKAVSVLSVPKEGRASDTWLTVVKDEATAIKNVQDLKGKTIEAATAGSIPDLLTWEAVTAAGLKPGVDATITHRANTIADLVSIAKAKGADVVAINEPLATQAEQQGIIAKWKSYIDLMPWFQGVNFSVSKQFLAQHRDAVVQFVAVYIAASRLVDASNGEWTPDLLSEATTRGNVSADVIKAQGGVPYYLPDGLPTADSLTRVQDVWLAQGLLKSKVDVSTMLDTSIARDAAAKLGK